MHVSFWFHREIRLLSLVYLQKIFGINECHTFDMISPSLNKNSFAVDIKNLLKLFHTYRVWILTCMIPVFIPEAKQPYKQMNFLNKPYLTSLYIMSIPSQLIHIFSYRHFFACCRFSFFTYVKSIFSAVCSYNLQLIICLLY